MGQRVPLVIWGAGGHALVLEDIAREQGIYEPLGFLDDVHPERRGEAFGGASVLGGTEILRDLHGRGVRHAVVAIGDNQARMDKASQLVALGFELAILVHPRAVVAKSATLASGVIVAAGAVINPFCRIGANGVVNTLAGVDHHCDVGEGANICPGARLAGSVTIGRAAWIGIGAVVVEKIRIGAEAFIGAGAVVLRDIPDKMVAYGVPARVVRPWRDKECRKPN